MIKIRNLEETDENNFMDYYEMAEVQLLEPRTSESFCYRCNSDLKPLTYLEPDFYHLPCWGCMSKNIPERKAISEGILYNIKDFYSIILGDRFYQLFVVDDIYLKTTFPHSYTVFKKVLNALETPVRSDIWFLDWIPGYPKIINLDNLPGLKIVNVTKEHSIFQNNKEMMKVDDFEVYLPETVDPDTTHRSRYSLFAGKNGRSRRVDIGDTCYKLYDTNEPGTKSVFRLKKFGEDYPVNTLTHKEFVILKLAIMRNKTFLRFLFTMLFEILKNTGVYRDTIFLKNTVVLSPDNKNKINLVWTTKSPHFKKDNEYINLSII